jgi:anti-anti-sigma regulatory factor
VLRRINTVGGELRLVCSTPRILDLFSLTGLDRVFDLRSSLADATDATDAPADAAHGLPDGDAASGGAA